MKDEKEAHYEMRMHRWKMREELLNSMGEKELRAFIKGYMIGQRAVLKRFGSHDGCNSGCNCGGNCDCERKE